MLNSFKEYMSMGGNGFYIWTGYLIPLSLIFSFVLLQRVRLKLIKKKMKENEE
ncbi:MAG: hypothetical protein VXW97_00690 [Pseudomonadota bacterium]|nr:hypothetical protein [Pseudomonadota bacterium]